MTVLEKSAMLGILWVHADSQIPRHKGLIESLSFILNSMPQILSLKGGRL